MNNEHSSPPSPPQGGVPTMALAQHCHQLWRHPGSNDHRSATPPACLPHPCCAAPSVRKRLSLESPLFRSPSCSAKAPPPPSTWSRITCRSAQPACMNPLPRASPHACPTGETSGGLAVDSLKRPLTGALSQRNPVRSPSRGQGTRTTHRQGQSRFASVCELATHDARVAAPGNHRQPTGPISRKSDRHSVFLPQFWRRAIWPAAAGRESSGGFTRTHSQVGVE